MNISNYNIYGIIFLGIGTIISILGLAFLIIILTRGLTIGDPDLQNEHFMLFNGSRLVTIFLPFVAGLLLVFSGYYMCKIATNIKREFNSSQNIEQVGVVNPLPAAQSR